MNVRNFKKTPHTSYQLICQESPMELEKEVSLALDEGFVPLGAPAIIETKASRQDNRPSSEYSYSQAVFFRV